MALALLIWSAGTPRPDLLIAPEGRLVGLMTPAGRALDHPRSQSFAARNWLRRDADPADQERAAARAGLTVSRGRVSGMLDNGWRLELVKSRRPDVALLEQLCAPKVLLVARHGGRVRGPCLYLGRHALRRDGGVAVWTDGDWLRLRAAGGRGGRPWMPGGRPE